MILHVRVKQDCIDCECSSTLFNCFCLDNGLVCNVWSTLLNGAYFDKNAYKRRKHGLATIIHGKSSKTLKTRFGGLTFTLA